MTGVTIGREFHPLVVLEGADGQILRLTETHPVLTATGNIVRADELYPGDTVLADDGPLTLVDVRREAYPGQVYNLSVGEPREMVGLSPWDATLVAEGFVVGDANAQWRLTNTFGHRGPAPLWGHR